MGEPSDCDRPSRHGALLGDALAQIAAAGRPFAPDAGDPCLTCAFRPGTLPNQSAGTGVMALNCAIGIDKDAFACHHAMADGAPTRRCAGYEAALRAPFDEVKAILTEMQRILPDDGSPDPVRARYDEWRAKVDPDNTRDVYELARLHAKSSPPPSSECMTNRIGGDDE